jgi:hypothetical protein
LHRRGFPGYVDSHDGNDIYGYIFVRFVDDSNLVARPASFFAVTFLRPNQLRHSGSSQLRHFFGRGGIPFTGY